MGDDNITGRVSKQQKNPKSKKNIVLAIISAILLALVAVLIIVLVNRSADEEVDVSLRVDEIYEEINDVFDDPDTALIFINQIDELLAMLDDMDDDKSNELRFALLTQKMSFINNNLAAIDRFEETMDRAMQGASVGQRYNLYSRSATFYLRTEDYESAIHFYELQLAMLVSGEWHGGMFSVDSQITNLEIQIQMAREGISVDEWDAILINRRLAESEENN